MGKPATTGNGPNTLNLSGIIPGQNVGNHHGHG
jgi:hypothetical protein